MPRTKEAISILKVFTRRENKQASPDTYQKGYASAVLATLEWMTNPDGAVPYAEDLEEDMPDDGGWEELNKVTEYPLPLTDLQRQVATVIDSLAPRTAPPPVNVPQFTPTLLEPGQLPPEQRQPLELTGQWSRATAEHPWLKEYERDLTAIQRGTPPSDGNAVIVGAGLDSRPRLTGGGYEEDD